MIQRSSSSRMLIGGSALVSFATMILVGCASSMSSSQVGAQSGNFSNSDRQTSDTLRYVNQNARQYQLPEQYLSEARVGLANVEDKLDTAKAAEIEREAFVRDRMARVSRIGSRP
jgi:hypothetical protein